MSQSSKTSATPHNTKQYLSLKNEGCLKLLNHISSYLSELIRLRSPSDFPCIQKVKTLETISIDLQEHNVEEFKHILNQVNLFFSLEQKSSSSSALYDEADDSFIIFQEEGEKYIDHDVGSVNEQNVEQEEQSITSATSVTIPTTLLITVLNKNFYGCSSNDTTEEFSPPPQIGIVVSIPDLLHYPYDPPDVVVQENVIWSMSPRRVHNIKRSVSHLISQWRKHRLLHPCLEHVIECVYGNISNDRNKTSCFERNRFAVSTRCEAEDNNKSHLLRNSYSHKNFDVDNTSSSEPIQFIDSDGNCRNSSDSETDNVSFKALNGSSKIQSLSLSSKGVGDQLFKGRKPVYRQAKHGYNDRSDELLRGSKRFQKHYIESEASESDTCYSHSKRFPHSKIIPSKIRGSSNISAVGPLETTVDHSVSSQTSRYFRDFEEIEILGVGAFGAVTRCRLRATAGQGGGDEGSTFFAIKRIPLSSETGRREDLALQREAASLAALHHPHIVRYHSAWIETHDIAVSSSNITQSVGKPLRRRLAQSAVQQRRGAQHGPRQQTILHIQMEYCSGQTLRRAIDAGAFVGQSSLIWILFRQILDGLACMHDNGLIHRDLKPCNIFLQTSTGGRQPDIANIKDIHIKIGDFGLATFAGNHPALETGGLQVSADKILSAGVGTKFYMSPEQERGGYYDNKADMFSLGVVLFELWHPPFKTVMERAVVLSRLLSETRELPVGFIKSVATVVPILIRQLLSSSPADRPSARSLLQSLLLPLTPAGEFQPVFDFISRHPFSLEAQLITRALFRRQLNFQAEHFGQLELRLLPPLSKARWVRMLAVTDVNTQLETVFRSRGAIRFEAPPVLPRVKPIYHNTQQGPNNVSVLQGTFAPPVPSNALLSSSTTARPSKDAPLPSSTTAGNNNVTSALVTNLDTEANTATASQQQQQQQQNTLDMVFLDRQGTPLYMPDKLAVALARTLPIFPTCGPRICRRFCIRNVENCSLTSSAGRTVGSATGMNSSNIHAYYDVSVKLLDMLDPDTMTLLVSKASMVASDLAQQATGPRNQAKYLSILLRTPFYPLSARGINRSILFACRELLSYNVVTLFEAELIAVARQALSAITTTQMYPSLQLYWTHGLLLPAILHELLDVPVDNIQKLSEELRWMSTMSIAKNNLYQKLYATLVQEPCEHRDNPTPLWGETQREKCEAYATVLYQILSFSGSFTAFYNMLEKHIHNRKNTTASEKFSGGGGGSVLEILLKHTIYLSHLIGCVFRPSYFSLTLPFDSSMFGKGLVFVIMPGKTKKEDEKLKNDDNTISSNKSKNDDLSNQLGPSLTIHGTTLGTSLTHTENQQGLPTNVISNSSTAFHNSRHQDRNHQHHYLFSFHTPQQYTDTGIFVSGLNPDAFKDRLALGGRIDFLVSNLHPQYPLTKTGAFFSIELAIGNIISSLTNLLSLALQNAPLPNNPLANNVIKTATSNPTSNALTNRGVVTATHGPLLKRIVERPVPQVFIIVVRAEQQSYAANLRRQLLKRGIHCQRRVDRIVDTTQFRRRVKNSLPVLWVVQLRDQPSNGIAYKLQYYGKPDKQPAETETILDESKKVVDYLVEYFSTHYNYTEI